jgi:hypothetical protein
MTVLLLKRSRSAAIETLANYVIIFLIFLSMPTEPLLIPQRCLAALLNHM